MVEGMILDSFTYSIITVAAIVSFVVILIAWSDEKTHHNSKK